MRVRRICTVPLLKSLLQPVCALALGVGLICPVAHAQQSSSSSAPPGQQAEDDTNPATRPRAAQIEPGGAAVTLETSEPLFQMAAALNACGYDADLDRSAPVRAEVRADMNTALQQSEDARKSLDFIWLERVDDVVTSALEGASEDAREAALAHSSL